MATPSTLNQPPKFLTNQPDWSKGVELEPQWITEIKRCHDSTEQRTRRRRAARYRIKYVVAALNTTEFSKRRARVMRELLAPIVVPMWPLRFNPVYVSSPVLTFGNSLVGGPFRVGWMVYINEPGVGEGFWPVSQIYDNTLTLDVDTPLLGFTYAADVWPCIAGYRPDNTTGFDMTDLASTDETVEVIDQ